MVGNALDGFFRQPYLLWTAMRLVTRILYSLCRIARAQTEGARAKQYEAIATYLREKGGDDASGAAT